MNEYIPFHSADLSRSGLIKIPEFKLSYNDENPCALTDHFSVRRSSFRSSFIYAAQKIADTCKNNVVVAQHQILFPYIEPDSKRPHWPTVNFYFIGCSRNTEKSLDALTEHININQRNGFDSTEFSPYDLDPVSVIFEKRARHLERNGGLPAGMVDKTNSVFIVTDPEHGLIISQALSGTNAPAP